MNIEPFSKKICLVVLTASFRFSTTLPQAPPPPYDVKLPDENLKALDKPSMAKRKALNEAGKADLTKEESAGAAFDAVIDIYHPSIKVPKEVSSLLRPRVAAIEAMYWRGKSKGVADTELATTLNDLATKSNMPPGATTTESQVRTVRLMAAASVPSFGAKKISKPDGTYNDTMSPLQALHVTLTLMDLKSLNPDFAVDPDVWEKNLKAGKHSDEWLKEHSDGIQAHAVTERNESILLWLQLHFQQMSFVDGVDVISTIMASLGLQ